jgi:hypothetical protein
MSQIGEAHKMMMRQMEWAREALETAREWMPPDPDGGLSEGGHQLETACLHLDNALRMAEQIDSGVVYSMGASVNSQFPRQDGRMR